ncbi:MAG TPA: c-type cytochrome [Actinomycetota bacterium]|jgi:mono/diheme cytochrome c family protein
MLALSSGFGVALVVLGGLVLVLVVGGVLALRARGGEPRPDIPRAMRPGPADAALETPLLQKLQGWAVILVAFMAIWVPLNWLREPSTNLAQDKERQALSIERGHETTLYFSEENQLGAGCVRCHGPELHGGVIQAGANPDGSPHFIYPANLTVACTHLTVEEIRTTIEQGRVAAGMPSWSIKFEGAMDDQQIDDLVQYIVSINDIPFSENHCLNPDLASPSASAAASPSASPSGGA